MMGLSEKRQESLDITIKYSSESEENKFSEFKRSCADCQTTKTPLWRGGPAGPKSLCNACGIRERKRRRALLGLNKGDEKSKKEKSKKCGVSLRLRLLPLGRGRDVLLQRYFLQRQSKLAEEEEAAMLLMALSCGSVYS
eukprot:TRINITY_DN15109_c0_g6_i2.p1 TRINITY_DN15109_c0_g6~~TRINITY_DN15109_c0_g6_i2.p1  ORF type:complete len:139 (-),score=28.50 TRINITY_DN15109_c0_g6_i2:274-690(-)